MRDLRPLVLQTKWMSTQRNFPAIPYITGSSACRSRKSLHGVPRLRRSDPKMSVSRPYGRAYSLPPLRGSLVLRCVVVRFIGHRCAASRLFEARSCSAAQWCDPSVIVCCSASRLFEARSCSAAQWCDSSVIATWLPPTRSLSSPIRLKGICLNAGCAFTCFAEPCRLHGVAGTEPQSREGRQR